MNGGAVDAQRSVRERLDDRLNPVLVKEVRQSLRGAYFRRTFHVTLSATLTIAVLVLVFGARNHDTRLGETFFDWIFGCLAVAVCVLVPILAYFSVGAEKEENTFDLLVLSNIKPRQIVLGKLHSALVLDLLFLSAAGPFLVCSYLLPGADPLAMLYMLVLAAVVAVVLALIAIAVSTFTSIKFLRVLLLAALFAGLMLSMGLLAAFCAELMRRPDSLRDDDLWLGSLWFLVALLFTAAFAVTVAAANLAHPDENRSTPIRAVCLVACAVVPIALGISFAFMRYDPDVIMGFTMAAMVILAVPSLFLVTEPERLTRRTEREVPRSRLLALVAACVLPGGGRGMLFLLLQHAVLFAGGFLVFSIVRLKNPGVDLRGFAPALAVSGHIFICLGLPAVLASNRRRGRVFVRVMILTLPLLLLLVPSLVGLMLDIPMLADFEHPGNPIWLIDKTWSSPTTAAGVALLAQLAVALLVLLLNVPRMLRGVREVLGASAARRDGLVAPAVLVEDAGAGG